MTGSGDARGDVAVIGAGPAGLAAAVAASRAGLRVVLIDGEARLGGQFHRHPGGGRRGPRQRGFERFERLRDALAGRVEVRSRHQVWAVEHAGDGFVVRCLAGERDERPVAVAARRLVIATGAHDLPLPFPGWDLPGVMTAGGAQALLKGNLVVAGRRAVVAGTGPFLLPVAAGLAEAGADVAGVFEANAGLAIVPALLRRPGRLAEAAGYGRRLARRGVPYRIGHAVVAAHGDRELTHVTVAPVDENWRIRPGAGRTVECDALAVTYGFVPRLDLAVQLGCATAPDGAGGVALRVDAGMRTSVPGVYAAGEVTGVGGADLAETEGWIAGRAVAADLGRPVRPAPALSAAHDRRAAFARALRRAYPVKDGWTTWLTGDTIVCRCEEVPYDRVREARDLGARDARAIKLLARPGMGWCQGRMCGYAVSRLAGEDPTPPRRPIAQPIRLGDLARPPAPGAPHPPPTGHPPARPDEPPNQSPHDPPRGLSREPAHDPPRGPSHESADGTPNPSPHDPSREPVDGPAGLSREPPNRPPHGPTTQAPNEQEPT